ncbi:MAG: precorrin-3B C(17)-methyltransferase [Clostridia bacterium]
MQQLYVVGIGPGEQSGMTLEADAALQKSDVIIGYTKYIALVRPYYENKEFAATGMLQEVDRCKLALEMAASGRNVAVVCSGDAGVYGMAGLIYELSESFPTVEIFIVPGVTAALAGGALLGAPLTSDFAVVSLSNLLTPWERIEKRVACAAEADFAICIYNPMSKGRPDFLRRACEIMLRYKPADTVCGIAKNIGREGENTELTTLAALADTEVDMFTTVFVGNAQTIVVHGKMVSVRGYQHG